MTSFIKKGTNIIGRFRCAISNSLHDFVYFVLLKNFINKSKLHSLWLSSNVPPSSAVFFNSITFLSTIFWLMAYEVSRASQNFRYVGVVKNFQNRLPHPLLNFPWSASASTVAWTNLTVSLSGGSSYSLTLTSNAIVPKFSACVNKNKWFKTTFRWFILNKTCWNRKHGNW